MDLDKLKSMAAAISESISTCEVGELLFMHHVILETIDVVQELPEEDATRSLCVGIEQSIYNEIARRISTGDLKLDDPSDFLYKVKDYYTGTGVVGSLTEDIKSNILNKKRDKRKAAKEFDEKLAKRGSEFFNKYRSMFKMKPVPYSKVPTPDEIINNKSPKDIPNN